MALRFYKCIQLLEYCVKADIISKDPDNQNNIMVYRAAGECYPEGWYSENLMTAAAELTDNEEGQATLLAALHEKGVTPVLEDPWWENVVQEVKL